MEPNPPPQTAFGWRHLQNLLKQQYIVTVSESEQKNFMQKRLTSLIVTYHNNYIQLLQEREGKQNEPEKKILKDDGFDHAYLYIKESVLILCRDFRIMREIVKKNDDSWTEQWVSLSKLIVNNLYENLVEEQIYNKDVMFLMVDLIDIVIGGSAKAADVSFLTKKVSCKILKEFTQREEIKRYCQNVLRTTLLAIAKVDQVLDLDNPSRPKPLRLSKQLSRQQRSSLSTELQSTALTPSESSNSTKLYSEIFKNYDVRKGWSEKDSFYMSRQLLKYLGVSEESSYPTFISKKARRTNLENDINLKFNKILEVTETFEKENKLPEELEETLTKIKNIVNTFFASVFKNLYSIPASIRVLCKAIEILILRKFPSTNRPVILMAVGNFLFFTWLLPEMYYQDKVVATGIVSDEHNKNALLIQQMIQRVLRGQYFSQDLPYKKEGNKIIRSLHASAENYLEEILNISEAQVRKLIDKQRDERICSYSACLSFEDLRVLYGLILDCKDEIQPINDKLVNRVNRVKDMTDGFEVLKGRLDKQDNKFYNSQQAYVLFTELILPRHLQTDYYKQYMDSYKSDKRKNLLRQILVSTEPMNRLEGKTLREHFKKLVNKYRFKKELNSLDKLPVDLKIKYLLQIMDHELEPLGEELLKDYSQRITTLMTNFDQTKAEFLKAKQNVKKYENQVIELQKKHSLLKKKKLLGDFIDKTKINICLTSPKTREGEIAMKSNSIKSLGPERQKIWLEYQHSCIHTTLNLQFIKSLTGQPDKKKKDQVGHCNTIRKFVETFSSLPEVKMALVTGDDRLGIKSTFYEFIKYCVELAKGEAKGESYKDYRELLSDEQWFEDQLERNLTWRLYERVFPKSQTYADAAIYFRMKTLDWIEFQHLNIQPNNRVESLWRVAAKQLLEMDQFKTPNQKLECIINCTETMTNVLSLTSEKDEPASADTTYPIMVYILLKACPRRLVSNLNFIDLFSNSNKMMSGMGYCFIQIKSAITFFEILNETKLCAVSRIEYEKKIYDKQNQYGVYFLKKRPRSEKKLLDKNKLRELIMSYRPKQ